jgi:WhiB family transcriptional regulator, redox-sensing transcriptional regulator
MTDLSRLPGPLAGGWDWQRAGACRGRDSGQFFHPDGERGASRMRRETAAKVVCLSCPVRAECAAHALAAREPYGIWGGFTEGERARLLATGWEDLSDRRHSKVDVPRLEARLLPRPRRPGTASGPAGPRTSPATWR